MILIVINVSTIKYNKILVNFIISFFLKKVMNQKEQVIRLDNVKKYYYLGQNVVKALDGINVSVNLGDFVAIMGPSGSGKSTAMNMIGSLDKPSGGRIYLDGKDINSFEESKLAQLRGKKIGFIFQQFNLIPNLTALENVALPLLFQGIDEITRIKKAKQLLEMMELKDRLNHYPNQLSGGQQQRVAIARSLANEPEVILADEPTGNLDTKTGEIVMEFLEKMHKKGKTIIIVTHDPELALEYANKIYWIKDGNVEKITKKQNNKWLTIKE
jgi:putative ABC transport system ATP-binding protein